MPPFAPCLGLIIVGSRQPVPLLGISVDVQVKGFVADVSATLKYKNTEKDMIKSVFVFPMDNDSAVYSFEATIEGKKVVADLQEKKQAQETFKEAINKGKQAFLLEEDESSADIFRCSVGNLQPGQDAEVSLKYVLELPIEADGAVRFVLPAVLNPRYTPKGHDLSITAIYPLMPNSGIPYTLSLTAHFQSVYGVAKIQSNCHITPLEYTDRDKTGAKVSLTEGYKFEQDVELLAYYMDVNKPSVIVEAAAQESRRTSSGSIMAESVAMLNFYPRFPAGQEEPSCGEFIFLVDRSGSMSCMGSWQNPSRIESAKETLVVLLKSLPLGCYFNIYGFGSHFEAFFPESVEYTQKSMEEAVKKVKEMAADFGGTEILKPLRQIYQTAGRGKRPLQLFVLTDGEVENTKEVIDEVRKNAKRHRCFTIGIGEGVSTTLLKEMARAGGGIFDFITNKNRMQAKVLRALKCSIQLTVLDISLKWALPTGMEAIVLSKIPTAIFKGQRSIIYAQLKGKVENEAEGEVCLQYKFQDQIVKNTLRFPLNVQNAERPTIHRLAAKALISELEHGRDTESEEVKKKILETSLQAGVVSSLSAFVAVNETNPYVADPSMRKDVPGSGYVTGAGLPVGNMRRDEGSVSGAAMPVGNLPRYEGRVHGAARPSGYLLQNEGRGHGSAKPEEKSWWTVAKSVWAAGWVGSAVTVNPIPIVGATGAAGVIILGGMLEDYLGTKKRDKSEDDDHVYIDLSEKQSERTNQAKTLALGKLISLQNADGSCNLTPEVSDVLGISETEIRAGLPDQSVDMSVWVSVLTVIWLHTNSRDKREEWELMEMKAISLIKAKAGSSLDELVRAGTKLLNSSVNPKVFNL